ncbi:MAG: metalloregulator ArsR/SmtB family transcription factor [Actinomycetota bacterium]|nr:metalloregulator ArsR/SmtB family transcription factor [Actinomycetota bacterium]
MRRRDLPKRPGVDPRADEVAVRLSALADPVRLRLLGLLARGDCPVGLLASALGVGQSLVSFHVAALRAAGLVATQRVGRFTYARLQHGSLGGLLNEVVDLVSLAEAPMTPGGTRMRTVVFACVHNAGRSQMAAALFNRSAPDGWRAVSAGTRPADHVHPPVVDVMAEVGVDLSTAQPQLLTPEMADDAVLLVTMGCGEECPSLTVPRQDWPVADPAGLPLDEVRTIRDELRDRVTALLVEVDDAADLDADERAAVHRAMGQIHPRLLRLLGRERVERVVAEEVRRFRGARVRTFMDILVSRHAQERLRAVAQAEGRLAKAVPEVLFVCVHNAGRSQMAAALAKRIGGDRIHAWSAGTEPADQVLAGATAAMAEVGIDLSASAPKPWTNELVRAADVVVTMGCGDNCPYFPGVRYVDWQVPDPAGKPLDEVRAIRDDLAALVEDLVASLAAGTALPRATTNLS